MKRLLRIVLWLASVLLCAGTGGLPMRSWRYLVTNVSGIRNRRFSTLRQ